MFYSSKNNIKIMEINIVKNDKYIIVGCEDIYNYSLDIMVLGSGGTYHTVETIEKEPNDKMEICVTLNSLLKKYNAINYKYIIRKFYGQDIIETLESDHFVFKK